jgi:hypothetical protein
VPGLRVFDEAAAVVKPVPRANFDGRIAQLRALVAAGQYPNIPQTSKEHAGLSGWLGKQRQKYRKGTLKPERLASLRVVPGLTGFDEAAAVVKPRVILEFDVRIAQLRALVADGQDPNLSSRSTEHAGLGGWLKQQREALRKGALKPERLAKLRTLPGLCVFDDAAVAKPRVNFDGRIAQLRALLAAGQDPNIPQTSKEHAGLGCWLHNERHAHRKGTLLPQRLAQLRAVPGLRGFN